MDFDEAKRRLKIAAAVCVVVGGAWWAFSRVMDSSARKRRAPEPEAMTPAVPERIAAADKLGFKDPVAGLVAMRAIAAAPRDAEEKALAEKRVPSLLVSAHRAAGAAKDWLSQASLWSEIIAISADEPSRRRLVQDDRASWLMRALQEKDDASADRLAAAMIVDTGNDEINPRHALKEWRSRQVEKWRAARAAKDEAAASAALAALSAWEPLDSDVPRDIFTEAPPAELAAMADAALRRGAHAEAAVLLRAAIMGRGDQSRARALLDDAIMGIASGPDYARPAADGLPPSVRLYLRVNGPRRVEALTLAAGIMESRADAAARDTPHLSAPLYDEAQRLLREAASIERAPLADEVAARLSGKAADARLGATLKKLDADPENAFAELRPLLRDGKDEALAQRAFQAVIAAWRKARDAKAFDRAVDLTAFLIAEAGPPPADDPFRAEFKAGLLAMAEDAKKEGLNKRVFVLSLLADAFPEDREARDARREAAARGAELARGTVNRGKPPAVVGNSGLTGRSAALVENGTPHHILMLFEGPETFFVRINPYRRGSIVLKDGNYTFAVAAIKDDITPYAAAATFGSVLVREKFVVVAKGPAGPLQARSGFGSYGNWTLLRAPDGEKYTVSPLNGTVRP